jgi:hypothetical protein
LPAVAVRRDHEAARHLVCDLRAVVEPHQVETKVDAPRRSPRM